jgi:integrase
MKRIRSMPLRRFVNEVYLPQKIRVTSGKTREHYQSVCTSMARALLREPVVADVTDEGICRTLRYLASRELSPHTIQQRRNYLVAIANWCARRGILPWPSVERYPAPQIVPKAWAADQLSRLWEACAAFEGQYAGILAAHWWKAFHAVCWDTGERTGAVLAIRVEWVDLQSGTLEIPAVARKGGRQAATYTLKPLTVNLLRPLLGPGRKHVFAFPGCKASFYNAYTRLLKLAGLPSGRQNKPQKIRRTFASFLELAGGDATEALNHSNRKVTKEHYLDPTIIKKAPPNRLLPPIDRPPPSPPPLG